MYSNGVTPWSFLPYPFRWTLAWSHWTCGLQKNVNHFDLVLQCSLSQAVLKAQKKAAAIPLTAYSQFVKDTYPVVKAKNPGLKFTEVGVVQCLPDAIFHSFGTCIGTRWPWATWISSGEVELCYFSWSWSGLFSTQVGLHSSCICTDCCDAWKAKTGFHSQPY